MRKKRRYRIKVCMDMSNPINMFSLDRTHYLGRGMTKLQALRKVKNLKHKNPQYKYRIVRSKGLSAMRIGLGFVLFVLCLALVSATPDIFNLSSTAESYIQYAFFILGLLGLFGGMFK